MQYLLIFYIIMFSCAIAGLGGGIILKPLLDFLDIHSLEEISFISVLAVLTMSALSVILKLRKQKIKLDTFLVFTIGISSIIGGFIGTYIFNQNVSSNASAVQLIQSILLVVVLIFVLISVNITKKRFRIQNRALIFLTGLLLGIFSTFIGISGGPINIAVFTILFSFDLKKSALYSLIVIVLSQLTKLFIILISINIQNLNLELLPEILIGAVLGAISGNILVNKLGNSIVKKTYNLILIVVICLTLFNIFS